MQEAKQETGWEELGGGIGNPELTAVMVAQGVGLDWVTGSDWGICVANSFLLQVSRGKWFVGVRKMLEDPAIM